MKGQSEGEGGHRVEATANEGTEAVRRVETTWGHFVMTGEKRGILGCYVKDRKGRKNRK